MCGQSVRREKKKEREGGEKENTRACLFVYLFIFVKGARAETTVIYIYKIGIYQVFYMNSISVTFIHSSKKQRRYKYLADL